MTKQILILALIIVSLSGCAALGTKTLYKNVKKADFKNLAFSVLDLDPNALKMFPQTDSIFGNTFIETFRSYNLTNVTPLNIEFYINKPDTNEIASICNANNFDGIIVSHLRFIHMIYTMNFIPIAKNWDTEVEMKLFDREGNLILSVIHNTTKGNSYFMPPSADKTIRDGTKGAINRLAKEMGLKNNL